MGRKPDYVLKIADREDKAASSKIGAGWLEKDGHINIRLDTGAHITWLDPIYINLFPLNKDES